MGDVSSPFELKHVANAEARTIAHNLSHAEISDPFRTIGSRLPFSATRKLASVGARSQDLEGREYVEATQYYSDTAYGWALQDHGSFCKLYADPRRAPLSGASPWPSSFASHHAPDSGSWCAHGPAADALLTTVIDDGGSGQTSPRSSKHFPRGSTETRTPAPVSEETGPAAGAFPPIAGTMGQSGTTGYRESVDLPEFLVADAAEWRTWLKGHHARSQGVWLVLAKKSTTHPTTLSYDEALDEAICFGWIDGQLGHRDNETYGDDSHPEWLRALGLNGTSPSPRG